MCIRDRYVVETGKIAKTAVEGPKEGFQRSTGALLIILFHIWSEFVAQKHAKRGNKLWTNGIFRQKREKNADKQKTKKRLVINFLTTFFLGICCTKTRKAWQAATNCMCRLKKKEKNKTTGRNENKNVNISLTHFYYYYGVLLLCLLFYLASDNVYGWSTLKLMLHIVERQTQIITTTMVQ